MAYQYYKGRYYIGNVKGRLSINPHCQSVHFEHEFRKFMVNTRIDDCEISNDNYDIGKAYMSFFHELTHLFQDFSLTACINEKIFKRIFGEEYIINNFTKFELDDGTKIKLGNLRLLWRTRIFPWLTSTGPHDCISKGKTSHPYILQTL